MFSFMQQIRRLRGELAWVLVGHIAAFVGGLFGIKMLTQQLGAAGYGHLALGLTIAGFLTTFFHNPISNAVARFYAPYRDAGKALVYFDAFRRLHRRLALWLTPFIIIATLLVGLRTTAAWSLLVLAGLLFGMTNGVWVSFLAWQNASRDRRAATLGQIADVWLRIGLGVLAAVLFGSAEASLFGYVIGTTLVVFWQNRLARCTENKLYAAEPTPTPVQVFTAHKEFVSFALPFSGFAVFTSLTLYADRWIIQGISGAASVGLYAAMFQLAASPVNILFAVINQLMVPIVYEKAGMHGNAQQDVRKIVRNLANISVVILTAIVLPLYVWSKPLARLFTTPVFAEQSGLIPLLVIGMGLFNVGQLFTLVGNSLNRPGIYVWPKAAHAVLLCLGGIFFTCRYGAYGMAFAGIVASVFYVVGILLINQRLDSGYAG